MIDWNTGSTGDADVSLLTPDNAIDAAQFERAVINRPRPSLLINERELSVLRRGLTKDGWKRTLYLQPVDRCTGMYLGAGLLSLANRWLEISPKAPEWNSDRSVQCCMNDDQFMLPCDDGISCTECPRPVGGSVSKIPEWRAQLHRLAAAAISLAVVYGIEKDKAYAEKAAQILRVCADAYAGMPETDVVCFDARCAVSLAQAYDLIYYSRCLNDDDKERLERQFLASLALDMGNRSWRGTEGAWRLAAVGLIGLALRDHAMVGQTVARVRAWLAELGDDGLAHGSLAGDHFNSLAALLHFSEACHRCSINLYALAPEPNKTIRSMITAPIRYIYPSFRIPATGIDAFDSFLPLSIYEVAYRRWGDPEMAWVLKRGYSFLESPHSEDQVRNAHRFSRSSFYAFLFGRDLPGRSAVMSPKSRAVSSQGFACLRNNSPAMLTVTCNPANTQRHCDALGFTLYANDQLLIPDYGAQPGSNAGWDSETWAHNTVVVDGQSGRTSGYSVESQHCQGTDFQGAQFCVRGCYPEVTHSRTVMLLGEVCVIGDTLEGSGDHTYDWLMRCEGKPEFCGQLEPVPVPDGLHQLIEPASAFKLDGYISINWEMNGRTLSHHLWSGPGTAEAVTATCPAETILRRVPMLICRQKGKLAEFVSVFVQTKSGQECRVSRRGGTLVVESGERVDYIQCGALGLQDDQLIKTNGAFAAIRTDRGLVQSIVLAEGSRVEWNGQLMLECPSEVECLEATFDGHGPQIKYSGGESGMLQIRTNARATRVNGYRATASNVAGLAKLRITPQMIS